jgi:ABC-type multidrug transport system fused ATPase/permease subunit
MRGRTVIAIAHRLTTLRGFDRIVDLGLERLSREPRLLVTAA